MTDQKLAWMIDGLVQDNIGVEHGIVFTTDGMLAAQSKGLPKDAAERMGALASSLRSLSQGATKQFEKGRVLQNFIEMEKGYFFVVNIGHRLALAVTTTDTVNMTVVVAAMNRLVVRLSEHLDVAPRSAAN
jgi:predicted regulator of Ras-like GTPase activity (Roadblock/LC7/MglB family)